MKQSYQKKNTEIQKFDFEAEQNLVGLFALLKKIDMRNNPELYKKKLSTIKEKEK